MAGGKAGFHEKRDCASRILDRKRLSNNGKLGLHDPAAQPPKQPSLRCPECGNKRLYRDGLRYLKDGNTIQRWLCRACGYRFSESQVKVNVSGKRLKVFQPSSNLAKSPMGDGNFSVEEVFDDFPFNIAEDVASHNKSRVTNVGKRLNTFCSHNSKRQVCVSEREAKNLVKAESRILKRAAGATETIQQIPSENIATIFHSWMQRQGYKPSTCNGYTGWIRMLLKRKADLWNPENVKEILAQQTWTDGFKKNVVDAYSCFLMMEGLTWTPPRYQRQETLPFIPLETEIDQLIAGCGKKIGTFLRGLKETGVDPGELWRVEWTDIDEIKRLIKINHPVRGHNPRILPISKEFIAMLKRLPMTSERLFGKAQLKSIYHNFNNQRKRISRKLENPRLLQIHFTTLRHWKGTMEYHLTKDPMHVKRILGHKSVKNTEIYIHLERTLFATADDDQFITKVATTIEEDRELIEAGFEYVTERDGAKIYRKRK